MTHLFAYGSLMCNDIMQGVCCQTLEHEAALLHDYSRRTVRARPFPALIEARGDQVEGVLYRGVSQEALLRLDRFEGQMYARQLVLVQLSSGDPLACEAFVIEPEYLGLVDDSPWDFEYFQREGRGRFEAYFVSDES